MPLQNRIDPWGNFVAIKARGEFLGNRGILHDDDKNIVKPWAHKNWVTCELSFKGIKRELFGPGSYTELFFWMRLRHFQQGIDLVLIVDGNAIKSSRSFGVTLSGSLMRLPYLPKK